jgi:hypothetical protein
MRYGLKETCLRRKYSKVLLFYFSCDVNNFDLLYLGVGNDPSSRLLFNVCAGAKHIRAAAVVPPESKMGGAFVILSAPESAYSALPLLPPISSAGSDPGGESLNQQCCNGARSKQEAMESSPTDRRQRRAGKHYR